MGLGSFLTLGLGAGEPDFFPMLTGLNASSTAVVSPPGGGAGGGALTRREPRRRRRTPMFPRVVVLKGADILIPLRVEVGTVRVEHAPVVIPPRVAILNGIEITIPLTIRVGKVQTERLADTEEEELLALLGLLSD